MKEYKCIVLLETYVTDAITPVITLNENELETLNKIALALPFDSSDDDALELSVINLPDPIPKNPTEWYRHAKIGELEFILASGNPKYYKEFKIKENLKDTLKDNFYKSYYFDDHIFILLNAKDKDNNDHICIEFRYNPDSPIYEEIFRSKDYARIIIKRILEDNPDLKDCRKIFVMYDASNKQDPDYLYIDL